MPQTPLESFHPALMDKDISFDEKTGRIRITAKPTEAPADEAPDEGEVPPLGEQHETIAEAVTPTAPAASNEVQELRAQLAQQNQTIQAMLIAQASGKPLAEVLGLQPAQPTEPDYSQFDLYEPEQRAALIRQIKADVKAEVMREHQPALEAAKVQQEFTAAEAKFKSDPQYQPRMVAALQLAAEMRTAGYPLSIEAAYGMASKLQTQPTTGAPPAAPPKTATRTITPEQAAAKAAQAAKLPGNSGVSGAGQAPVPTYFGIGDMGKMMLWNLQQASQR
jgi:hypothetical protein